jgi:hypothetical protein
MILMNTMTERTFFLAFATFSIICSQIKVSNGSDDVQLAKAQEKYNVHSMCRHVFPGFVWEYTPKSIKVKPHHS